MRTIKLLVILCAAALILTGCGYFAPVIPPQGGVVTVVKAPLDTDVEKTDLGTKTGSASSFSILNLVAFGDCSITAAARNGGLNKVNQADYKYINILFVFQKFETIVYGD